MGQPAVGVRNLAGRVIYLALELLVNFIGHADAAGANRMAKALQAAVYVDGQSDCALKESIVDVFNSLASGAELEIFVNQHLGDGKAVVYLSLIPISEPTRSR